MEKWKDIKDFNFPNFCLIGSEKVSLYKFIYILLLKNDAQLKQKSDKQKKKYNHPNLLKNKNHVPKKNITSKQKKKKKKKRKKE